MRRAPKSAIPCALARRSPLLAMSAGPHSFTAPSAFPREWQNLLVFAYFGHMWAHFGHPRARKWASRSDRMRFLTAAPWSRFYAPDRRTIVGGRGMRDGRGFVAIYDTSGPHPPKVAKTHRFLGVCVLAPSERSYPRGWSTGRVPFYRGVPDGPRLRSRPRGYGAIFCPQIGKNGRNSRDIPHFARGPAGPKSCPRDPLCYSCAVASDTPYRLCSTFGDPCDEIVTAGGIRGGISARSRANPSGFWHF